MPVPQRIQQHGPEPTNRRGASRVPGDHGLLRLQALAGNQAVASLLSVQRQKKKPTPAPAARSPFAQSVFDQLEKKNVTATGGALYLLNGCNPQELMATVDQLHPHREYALYGAKGPHGFDGPRLSTAIQASLSGASKTGVAALELLDWYRTYGSDVAGFWKDKVGPLKAARLDAMFLVYDRRVLDSFKKYLGDAPPAVAKKVSPLLDVMFDPPAKDIEIEFRPDQFVVPGDEITYPDGKVGPAQWPLGVMIAKYRGMVQALIRARGGPWESRKEPSGHTADPSKPGKYKLGGPAPVVTKEGNRIWKYSQIRWGAEIREVDVTKPDGKTEKQVEYRTERGAWKNTLTLKVPISRDDILVTEKLYGRRELVPPSWDLNEFGPKGYQAGDTDIYIHTTPPTEDQYHDKLEERLSFSHGCIHITPSERDKLEELKLLKKGVTIVIKPYKHRKETYGTPPEK